MTRNSVSNTVLEASRVLLGNTVKLNGVNTYTISSNFISWDAANSYSLTDIAATFGTRVTGVTSEVVGGSRDSGFTCGKGIISAYDFGLLYTVFTAMIMAKVELGPTFPVCNGEISLKGTWVTWFGNDAVIYSPNSNVIIPIKNADIEKICAGQRIVVSNFCSTDKYTVDLENKSLCLLRSTGDFYATVLLPECALKTYAKYFQKFDNAVTANVGSWEEGSGLGSLIDKTDSRGECLVVLEKYKLSPPVASVVSRDDLVVELTERYADTSNFFGSICYTDKHEIAIAVNFRRGLFIYYPWFVADSGQSREIKVDPSAKFPEFYNVTEGCNRILRYANTVNNRPLTAAQMDMDMFSKIRDAFLDMSLSRIPIQSAFGRVIIPEEILLNELTSGIGESLFCIVPIGIVGQKLICISSENVITAVTPSGWDLSSAFYDITEVIG